MFNTRIFGPERAVQLALALATLTALGAPAGAQVSSPDEICLPAANPCEVTTNVQVASGASLDFGARTLIVRSSGRLTSPGGFVAITSEDLIVERNGQINLRATVTGEAGGHLDLTVADEITVAGVIDVGGSSAGSITATFGRFVLDLGSGFRGQLLLDGTDADADGGALELSGDQVVLNGEIRANGGSASLGGDVIVDAVSTLTTNGLLTADGGESDAGSISLRAGGDLTVAAGALLRANGSLSGSGGDMTLEAGAADLGAGLGMLRFQGTILASGGSSEEGGGEGGLIELIAAGSCLLSGRITSLSGSPDGTGGDVTVACAESTAGDMQMGAAIDARGTGSGGTGGAVDLSAPLGAISVAAKIDSGGTDGGAGSVSVTAGTNLTLASSITSNGSTGGGGGSVSLAARAGAASTLRLTAAGNVSADGGGGSVKLDACETLIDLASGAGAQSATARGAQGRIEITGVRSTRIGGRLTAGSPGSIELVYRDLVPLIESTASLSPAATQRLDEALAGCGTPAPTRTRTATTTPTVTRTQPPTFTPTASPSATATRVTPTATPTRTRTGTATPTPTPTASPSPKPTPDGPFDTDCSGVAEPDETQGITTSIFDLFMAAMCANADQNGDGHVSAADQAALARKLAEP